MRSPEQECRCFCRYLMGCEPNRYVLQKYATGNAALELENLPADGFDMLLLAAAARSPLLARLADTYARFRRPRSMLRAKLQLLLAILETSPPYDQQFKTDKSRSPAVAFVMLAGHGLAFAATLLAAWVVFAPLQLGMSFLKGPRVEMSAGSRLLRQP
jgi:hypothetical protein